MVAPESRTESYRWGIIRIKQKTSDNLYPAIFIETFTLCGIVMKLDLAYTLYAIPNQSILSISLQLGQNFSRTVEYTDVYIDKFNAKRERRIGLVRYSLCRW